MKPILITTTTVRFLKKRVRKKRPLPRFLKMQRNCTICCGRGDWLTKGSPLLYRESCLLCGRRALRGFLLTTWLEILSGLMGRRFTMRLRLIWSVPMCRQKRSVIRSSLSLLWYAIHLRLITKTRRLSVHSWESTRSSYARVFMALSDMLSLRMITSACSTESLCPTRGKMGRAWVSSLHQSISPSYSVISSA